MFECKCTYVCKYMQRYLCKNFVNVNCIYVRIYVGQKCIGLASNIEGSEIINCTSGITQFGYQGDTCVIIYNTTLGQVKELWSCQENGEWINTSGVYILT